MTLDVARIKKDFPILERRIRDLPITFLDSAASSQKPTAVIEAMDEYYRTTHANVHRGAYQLAAEATDAMEKARTRIASFIGAPHTHEVVFTKNATEAINLFANSWGGANLRAGDVITAAATRSWSSNRSALWDIDVTNQNGERVAVFRGRTRQVPGAAS